MSEHESKIHDPRKYWLDEPRNVRKVIGTVFVICALLFVADAFYQKKSHFLIEDWFGFYAIFGFVMCVMLVLVAKLMRVFLIRDEEYYEKDD